MQPAMSSSVPILSRGIWVRGKFPWPIMPEAISEGNTGDVVKKGLRIERNMRCGKVDSWAGAFLSFFPKRFLREN